MKDYWKIVGIGGILIGLGCLTLSGCGQFLAKNWGGTSTITLQSGERLEMITWKGDNLWVQLRPRGVEEKPITHVFREYSTAGILEGKIIVKEQ
jgi:hypothetical protein